MNAPNTLNCTAVDASLSSTIITAPTPNTLFRTNFTNPTTKSSTLSLTPRGNHSRLIRSKSLQVMKVAGVEEFSAAADAAPAGVTWQIVVGALAGATPFVVAGIEFSKRIIAQRTCDVCEGSGLVLKKENYVRCSGCGGFLPGSHGRDSLLAKVSPVCICNFISFFTKVSLIWYICIFSLHIRPLGIQWELL